MAVAPTQPTPGSVSRSRSQPPAANYPQLQNLKIGTNGALPNQLTQAIQQSFETTYSVRDQTTANADAINHMLLYGSMQQRLDTAPTAVPDGALWYVTDYPNAVYQNRVDPKTQQLAWFYATGVVWQENAQWASTVGFALGPNDLGYTHITGGGYIEIWNGKSFDCKIKGPC